LEIGQPLRIITVEPVVDPVPPAPDEQPGETEAPPVTVEPSRTQ